MLVSINSEEALQEFLQLNYSLSCEMPFRAWDFAHSELSSPSCAMQVCDVMYFCNPRCESREIRALDGGPKHAICAVRYASQEFAFAMLFIISLRFALPLQKAIAMCGHDAGIIASAMPRCGELAHSKNSTL